MKTHNELIKRYQNGEAKLAVNHINHREFVMGGTRYFCGYSSQRDSTYKPQTWTDPEYKVQGWITYKTEAVNQ